MCLWVGNTLSCVVLGNISPPFLPVYAVVCCGVSPSPQVVVCESKLRALLAELTAMRARDPTSKVRGCVAIQEECIRVAPDSA